jgi:UDP-glucose:(heptosyl)LPS alpha-1,3-glucosyltransferase
MKIAIVIEQFTPGAGGNERSTEQIARRLTARGHAVTILTNQSTPDAGEQLGVEVREAEGPKTNSWWGLLLFRRWATRQLDAFDASLSVTLAVPATVVQPRGGTYRETLRSNIMRRPTPLKRLLREFSVLTSPKQLAMLWAEYRTLNSPRVKKIIAISHFVADQLFEHYAIPSRRIETIPNAASIVPFEPQQQAATRAKVRQLLGLDESDVVFLFAAMNPGLKGLSQLLKAMAEAGDAARQARLVVAGASPVSEMNAAEALGIADRIRWVGLTGQIDAFYQAADVTVLPTFYDPASKVVIESLLHGKPAISTRYNGASQWIVDPPAGATNTSPLGPRLSEDEQAALGQPAGRMIDRPDATDQLARAITDLCDADERQRCTAAAAQLDPRLNMDAHVDALEKVIVEHAGS